jgi:hypothetical protein
MDIVRKDRCWEPGNEVWNQDKELILFYAQCLDRPAFRTYFHNEMSFSAFDRAMEDTLLAINTGYWRTRDGAIIDRAKGKSYIVHASWRDKLDKITKLIEEIRSEFQKAAGFIRMLYELDLPMPHRNIEMIMERRFRGDRNFGRRVDEKRNKALMLMNSMLKEIDHQPLSTMDKW